MMRPPYLIGALDIGSTKTCAVIGELVMNGDGPSGVRILGVGQVKLGGIRRDAVSNLEETTAEIRQAMKQAQLMAGVQPHGLYVGISAEYVETSTSNGIVAIGADEISEEDVERVHEVARAVVVPPDRELLHVIPQDYLVDHRGGIQHPVGMLGTRLEAEVFMVMAVGTAARNLRKAVTKAGYEVTQLVVNPLALGLGERYSQPFHDVTGHGDATTGHHRYVSDAALLEDADLRRTAADGHDSAPHLTLLRRQHAEAEGER
ncbi:MAG: cell division protein FtsA, partial [Gemmatimonadota bacterium]